jgi:predicted GNAT superfamily acetyltransferase
LTDGITIRVLASADEVAPLPAFEKFIWGADDEAVSVNLLVATISEGGVALGAFDSNDDLVGSVYGFATNEVGVLHSHYLAVSPEYRSAGLGAKLKLAQAEWCLANGYTSMRWTYDPLQLVNAHLNLNKLGSLGVAYHVNHYGALGGINGGMPSDRLTVQWWFGADPIEVDFRKVLEVDVPDCSPDHVRDAAPEAFAARYAIRESMRHTVGHGWAVVGVDIAARRYRIAPVVG